MESLALAAALLLTAPSPAPAAEEPQRFGVWGIDLSARDLAVKPGQDFNLHANGTYLRSTPVPPDKTSIGAFEVLQDLSEAQLKAIVEELSAGGKGGEAGLVATLYRSFMDEARLEKLGKAPLQKELARIRAARTPAQLARLMGESQGVPGGSLFGAAVMEDLKLPGQSALYLVQAGIGLPDRDLYLAEPFAEVRTAYRTYVAQMLAAVGWRQPRKAAEAVYALEEEVARAHWTRAQRRQMDKIYNAMTPAELAALAPGFPWQAWLEGAGVPKVDRLVVMEKDAFPALARIFAKTPPATQQAWLAFQLADQSAPYLSKQFSDLRFAFRGKVLSGQQEQRARAKRGVLLVDEQLGDALGRIYVERHFPASSKAKMEALVADLVSAMGDRIRHLEWMSPATKEQGLRKLSRLGVKVGYPVKWRDYAGLALRADDLYGNVVAASRFNQAWSLDKLGKPLDPAEWGMTPQTVNAYYNPARNEIVFPAAILQPPFFDPSADAAVNYGAIGAVIGHEITHGFDDQGRKSDAEGALRDWWTAEDAARFDARAKALAEQYSSIEALPGARVNGTLTVGENIADVGGLLVAWDAWKLSLGGKAAPVLDGVTGEQRFFYAWAQVWRSVVREEYTRKQLVTDVHAPAAVRARAPMRNVDAWYEAFSVQAGEPAHLPPENRVRIW